MTNENKVIELINSNHTTQNALLWERILTIAALTRDSIKSNPEPFNTAFTNASHWIELCDSIDRVNNMQQPETSIVNYLMMHDDAFRMYEGFSEYGEYLSLTDCVQAMQDDSAPFEIYPYHEGITPSVDLVGKCMEYTNYIVLTHDEMEELSKEGLA